MRTGRNIEGDDDEYAAALSALSARSWNPVDDTVWNGLPCRGLWFAAKFTPKSGGKSGNIPPSTIRRVSSPTGKPGATTPAGPRTASAYGTPLTGSELDRGSDGVGGGREAMFGREILARVVRRGARGPRGLPRREMTSKSPLPSVGTLPSSFSTGAAVCVGFCLR